MTTYSVYPPISSKWRWSPTRPLLQSHHPQYYFSLSVALKSTPTSNYQNTLLPVLILLLHAEMRYTSRNDSAAAGAVSAYLSIFNTKTPNDTEDDVVVTCTLRSTRGVADPVPLFPKHSAKIILRRNNFAVPRPFYISTLSPSLSSSSRHEHKFVQQMRLL
jgi:hypothetical protein